MKINAVLVPAVLAVLVGVPAQAATVHDCDFPGPWMWAIHQADQGTYCKNHDNEGHTAAGNCRQETDGPGLAGDKDEFLVCSMDALPGAAAGCSFQVVRWCGGSMRSGEISCELNYDGTMPTAGPDSVLEMMTGRTLVGYSCKTKTSATTGTGQYCGCWSDGTWECPVSF